MSMDFIFKSVSSTISGLGPLSNTSPTICKWSTEIFLITEAISIIKSSAQSKLIIDSIILL